MPFIGLNIEETPSTVDSKPSTTDSKSVTKTTIIKVTKRTKKMRNTWFISIIHSKLAIFKNIDRIIFEDYHQLKLKIYFSKLIWSIWIVISIFLLTTYQ